MKIILLVLPQLFFVYFEFGWTWRRFDCLIKTLAEFVQLALLTLDDDLAYLIVD
jgi:hypothetical protein